MNISKLSSISALFLALSFNSGISQATVIDASNNNPLSFSWSNSTADGLLQGNGSLTVSGFSTSTLTIAVTLNNTTAASSSRLTAWGFGINPNVSTVTFSDANDGGIINAQLNSIPSLNTIEVCAYGGNNCAGGANGGILGGSSDSFSLLLTTASNGGIWGTSVDINPIGMKYQTAGTSYEFTASTSQSNNVPEPSTMLLLGAGMFGLGYKRKFS